VKPKMRLQVILLSNIFTNHFSVYLSYSEGQEVLNGVNNVAKVSETAVIESTSQENLVSIHYYYICQIKTIVERSCVIRHTVTVCYRF
jgi:hypothetical protein